MGNSNGIISKPVRTIDPGQVLGITSRDVGTLCSSSKINMWAKYKPVSYYKRSALTEDERASVGYGIAPYTHNIMSNIYDKYSGLESGTRLNGWVYDKPKGAPLSPFRMRDFDGYDHKSPHPIGAYTLTGGNVGIGQNDGCSASLFLSYKDEYINISDYYEGWYFGVCVYKSNNNFWYATNDYPISKSDVSFIGFVSSQMATEGDYWVFPIICREKYVWSGPVMSRPFAPDNMFATLPKVGASLVSLTNRNLNYDVSMKGLWVKNGDIYNEISYTIEISNIKSGTSIRSNTLYLVKGDWEWGDNLGAGEYYRNLADISGTTSFSFSGSFTNLLFPNNYKLVLSLDYHVQEYTVFVFTPMS